MALLERVSTLVRANLNDLVDKAEHPEKMIKQVILDMQNQLLQVKTQVAIAIADQHLLERKQKENEDKVAEWMRKAELSVDNSALRIHPPLCLHFFLSSFQQVLVGDGNRYLGLDLQSWFCTSRMTRLIIFSGCSALSTRSLEIGAD